MAWKKGQSGNPGGRPCKSGAIRDLARSYTNEAIQVLVQQMRDKTDPKARVMAANHLLDRGWGRPTQPISGDEDMPPVGVRGLSDEALVRVVEAGIKREGKAHAS